MKKILATALALTLTFGAFSLPVIENDFATANKFSISASAEEYGDFWYDVLDDGTAEITRYFGDSETVTIPNTINGKSVTSIGDNVFVFNEKLLNVTIPASVTSIRDYAFRDCDSLKNITVNSNNKNYTSKDGVLFNKEKTTLICCPIGNERTTYTIPNSVTSIGNRAFYDCFNLESISIPSSVTSIGDGAFQACSGFTDITIPASVTSIGGNVFYDCSSLADITIPNSVISIGGAAFCGCSELTSITIPASVTSIGVNVFLNCRSLKNITVNSNNKNYTSKDGVLFNKAKTTIIRCPVGNERTTYSIPSSISRIEDNAFAGCYNLSSITIPNSVTSIGYYAFSGCSSLTSVTIPASVSNIGDCVFGNCSSLTSVTIPNGVTSIGYYAFSDCSSLTDITIPNSVKSIKFAAFYNSNNLKDIYYKGSEAEWKNIVIGDDNYPLTNATIHYNSTGDSDTQKEISSCTISLPTATQYFRGTRIRPVVTIKDGNKVLKSGTDYTISYTNNLSVGKATVTITGKGDYKGTVTKNFDIVQRSIGNCDVELGAANYYFNGTRIKPSVKVYCNGTEMYNGNYTVAYSNNLSAGTATITLTGKKNLKGTVTKTFKINPRNIANCTISLTKNSDNEYQPTAAVKIDSNTIDSENYTVKYTTSADKKTVKVTITGKKNLTGSVTKTYTVQ